MLPEVSSAEPEFIASVTTTISESQVAEIVRQWLVDHHHNSPISEQTRTWNHLFNSVPALVAAIMKG
jgi:hypothetical protein